MVCHISLENKLELSAQAWILQVVNFLWLACTYTQFISQINLETPWELQVKKDVNARALQYVFCAVNVNITI